MHATIKSFQAKLWMSGILIALILLPGPVTFSQEKKNQKESGKKTTSTQQKQTVGQQQGKENESGQRSSKAAGQGSNDKILTDDVPEVVVAYAQGGVTGSNGWQNAMSRKSAGSPSNNPIPVVSTKYERLGGCRDPFLLPLVITAKSGTQGTWSLVFVNNPNSITIPEKAIEFGKNYEMVFDSKKREFRNYSMGIGAPDFQNYFPQGMNWKFKEAQGMVAPNREIVFRLQRKSGNGYEAIREFRVECACRELNPNTRDAQPAHKPSAKP